jgi:hypothetical protein
MSGKLTMVSAICFLLPASVADVQAMPGGFGQPSTNPDLLKAVVKVTTPTPNVTTPKISTTTPKTGMGPTLHGITPRNGTPKSSIDRRAAGRKPMVNGIGPVDPVLNNAGPK